ncbi:sodium:solute symporter family protein [Aestuariibacter sp. A3R04]|uniref:sodium:solute symporter family protein n=1 Tax=Aestuariibacter sp. A3R04 TaxID=2841571 RepID=UPI001C0937F6|nr:sodium:solute symporter family protein [Aestuariibacter sp. A3R04]MBU3021350.1 sodium:solute symporter family protein [Aestuariibacter sp. A3R04]
MESVFVFAFIAYMCAMIAVGFLVSRHQKSGEDFLLGGRSLPLLLTLGTTVATMVGTGSSMGAVGFAYLNGWAGTLYGVGGAVGVLLLAWLFAPVRQLKFMTMSEELSYYVGAHPLIKNLVACIIYVASIGWLGAHILGGGMYLSWLTGLDTTTAKLLIALSFTIYVVIGGYTAVVWTDSIQAILLFAGFILMAIFSVQYVGGWDAMLANQPRENVTWFAVDKIGFLPAISLSLAVLVGILATPSFRQRIYSGKNVKSVRQSFIYSGIIYLAFSSIPAIIGMSAYAMTESLENSAFAFPHIALNVMPMALGVFIIIAGISATLSSASSDAIAGVSVIMRDLYRLATGNMPPPSKVVLLSRVSLVLTIGAALGFALLSNDIISYITKMIAILMSGMCVCGLLGRFWPRYNWQGAAATLFTGMLSALAITLNNDWNTFWGNPVIPSVVCATFAGILISLCTGKSRLDSEHALAILAAERAEMEESR